MDELFFLEHEKQISQLSAQSLNRKLPIKALAPKPKLIAPVDNVSAWTPNNVTLSADTTKCLSGAAGLKITLGASGTAVHDISSTDFTDVALVVAMYFYPGTLGQSDAWTNINSITIDLYSGGRTTTDYRLSTVIYHYRSTDYKSALHNSGWNFCGVVPMCDYDSKGASFDITQVTRIRINTNNIASTAPVVTFSYIAFMPLLSKGGVVTLVDNFEAGCYEMAAYAACKGIKLTLSVVPNKLGTTGWGTLEQLRQCQDMGHFIINHTFNHDTFYLTINTANEYLDAYKDAYEWMLQNGFGVGASVLSVPGTYFDTLAFDTLFPITDAIFHSWAYGTAGQLWVPYAPAIRCIPQSSLDTIVTTNGLTSATNAGIHKAIAINGFHGDYWVADSGVAFKAYIDGIAALETVNYYGLDDVLCGNIV